MVIKFIRILGVRSKSPGVLAIVDGQRVRWNDGKDWDCECLVDDDEFFCDHIEAVRVLVDDRVLEPAAVN